MMNAILRTLALVLVVACGSVSCASLGGQERAVPVVLADSGGLSQAMRGVRTTGLHPRARIVAPSEGVDPFELQRATDRAIAGLFCDHGYDVVPAERAAAIEREVRSAVESIMVDLPRSSSR